MNLQVAPNKIMCQGFLTTIKGSARIWISLLKPSSISNFTELSRQFISYFISSQRHQKPATYLLNIKQSKGESLQDYMSQFNKKILQVDDAKEKMIVVALMVGLQPSKFLFSLSKDPSSCMVDLIVKAQQHMNVEDMLNVKRERDTGSNLQLDKRKREQQSAPQEDKGSQVRESNSNRGI